MTFFARAWKMAKMMQMTASGSTVRLYRCKVSLPAIPKMNTMEKQMRKRWGCSGWRATRRVQNIWSGPEHVYLNEDVKFHTIGTVLWTRIGSVRRSDNTSMGICKEFLGKFYA